MQNTISIVLSRMTGQQRAMDVTANNIANLATPGFRAERMVFADYLLRLPMSRQPPGAEVIVFAQDRATYRDTAPGPIATTGNPFDLAVAGEGFFQVETPRGPRLTRAGHFELSAEGRIVDGGGNPLLDTGGRPIQLEPGDAEVSVSADGTVSAARGQIGRIGIVRPEDPLRMKAEGGRLFAFEGPPVPVEAPRVVQGALEGSNVVATLELTRMMRELREFEFSGQMVQTEGERLRTAIDKLTQKRS